MFVDIDATAEATSRVCPLLRSLAVESRMPLLLRRQRRQRAQASRIVATGFEKVSGERGGAGATGADQGDVGGRSARRVVAPST